MRTEKEKMLAGELYDPLDPELVQARDRARDLCQDLNATREKEQEARRSILKQLFGQGGDSVWMQPPFFCDYGSNILLGERVFFNFNCVVLDVCLVKIGDFTLFGPAVQIYTGTRFIRVHQNYTTPDWKAVSQPLWIRSLARVCGSVAGILLSSSRCFGSSSRCWLKDSIRVVMSVVMRGDPWIPCDYSLPGRGMLREREWATI